MSSPILILTEIPFLLINQYVTLLDRGSKERWDSTGIYPLMLPKAMSNCRIRHWGLSIQLSLTKHLSFQSRMKS